MNRPFSRCAGESGPKALMRARAGGWKVSDNTPELGSLRRTMRARPKTSLAIGFFATTIAAATLGEALTARFGMPDILAVSIVAGVLGVAFMFLGFWLKNHHGGFAVLLGLIALICAALFPAMYYARPDLFPPAS